MWKKYYKNFYAFSFLMGINVHGLTNNNAAHNNQTAATNSSNNHSIQKANNNVIIFNDQNSSINWLDDQCIQNLLKTKGALAVCGEFSVFIKIELKKLQDHIEWIKDLFQEIQEKLKNTAEDIKYQLAILSKDIELMSSYYKDCFDELQHKELRKDSVYISCIEHLKDLKTATQNLRNSANSILTSVRILDSKSEKTPYAQDLKITKREIKLVDNHCVKMTEMIDQIIDRLTPLLRVYHTQSYEERNRGNFTAQSNRAL